MAVLQPKAWSTGKELGKKINNFLLWERPRFCSSAELHQKDFSRVSGTLEHLSASMPMPALTLSQFLTIPASLCSGVPAPTNHQRSTVSYTHLVTAASIRNYHKYFYSRVTQTSESIGLIPLSTQNPTLYRRHSFPV